MRFGRDKKSQGATTAAEGSDLAGTTSQDITSVQEQQENEQNKVTKTVSTASTHEYPTGLRLGLLLLSVFVSMFLVALDRLIISTVCNFSYIRFYMLDEDQIRHGLTIIITQHTHIYTFED
jgi:hypothetical protein